MSELPDDGDVIEFETVPEGSLCVPKVRYRVERKPLDREYLLVDTVSGHASRVQPHEFKRAKWALAKQEVEVPADQADEPAPVAYPAPEYQAPSGEGILNLEPLPSSNPPTGQGS
jgi:hypothetical protein